MNKYDYYKIYLAGYQAYYDGREADENPFDYLTHTQSLQSWAKGFWDAEAGEEIEYNSFAEWFDNMYGTINRDGWEYIA